MKNIRWITEGAVLLALYIVLLLATLYMPIVGIILPFTLPIPFLIFAMRHEWKYSLILLVAASLLSIVVSSLLTISTAIMFGTTGIVLGIMYKHKKRALQLLVAGALIYTINLVALYIISVTFFSYNFIQQSQELITQSIAFSEQFMRATGMQINENQLAQMKQLPKIMGYALPSLVIMGSFMMSWLTLIIATPILKRLRFEVQPWPLFREIQMPKSVLYYYVLFLVVAMFIQVQEGSYLYIAILNLNLILPIIMTIQGFSFLFLYCYKKEYPKFIPIVVVVLSIFIPFLFSLVSFLGIIDLGFSLRNRLK
ncbi:YybS family protein [Ectobacillus sp. sgz5001026]|uniref:YybS family protein n=1 Tax=Ectobacillus sp. sgz5001026 TaxID=3242473 RepID=UPI0036D2F1A5